MNYKCNKCNKEFKYESKLLEHKNRKISCNKEKEILKCNFCNITFSRLAHKIIHEKTKKHIDNFNKLKELDEENSNNILLNKNNMLKIKILELEKIINENERLKELDNKKLKELDNKIKILENKNKILENKNKILENENNKLKQNFKIHNNEYIYIIHCAQYINTNIYKIGQTKNIMNRFKQYPKGSEMLFMFSCINARQIESKILNYLKSNNNYIWYKDAGNEYFQCELDNLKSDISKIMNECKLTNGYNPDIINSLVG